MKNKFVEFARITSSPFGAVCAVRMAPTLFLSVGWFRGGDRAMRCDGLLYGPAERFSVKILSHTHAYTYVTSHILVTWLFLCACVFAAIVDVVLYSLGRSTYCDSEVT